MVTRLYKALFSLGRVVATPGVLESTSEEERTLALVRHHSGDWGEICREDKESNQKALTCGFRIFSSYMSLSGVTFWIITEHDRSVTTLLLPAEY